MAAPALNRPVWWQARSPLACLLLPAGMLFFALAWLRRLAFRCGLLRSNTLPVPVIVVGNIAVGGSGKTPVVIWLASMLKQQGWHPGILSRGYGGSVAGTAPVFADSSPAEVGDEPVLLAQRAACPLWIGRDRHAAGQALLAVHPEVDVLITDDGLQHYGLHRDAEVVVLDDAILGNQWPMPAGPLREPLARLKQASLLIAHGSLSATTRQALPPKPLVSMNLLPGQFYCLHTPSERCKAAEFEGKTLHAIAGIARPERFFDTLRSLGLKLQSTRALPDHHVFSSDDLDIPDGEVLLMTEKDAVKCTSLSPRNVWVLPVDAHIDEIALDHLLECLHGPKTA